jgi:hypothetical protein
MVEKLKDMIDLLCIATGKKINLAKSMISLWGINEVGKKKVIVQMFPYNLVDLDASLKYLGFQLKPNLYKICDWQWLIAKVEKKLNT